MRKQLVLVALLVLALRVPFLNQAIQGDDVNYLYGAEHAQIDPLHPSHVRYAFLGQLVDMRGHPHPPLNAWFLAALIAGFGQVREAPFHAAYIAFSVIAAVSALLLARRFSPHPLAATLMFLVTPAFVINGNSLESDVPFVAFWLASIVLYVEAVNRESVAILCSSAVAMAFAALAAYQAVVLVPLLLLYGWRWRAARLAALVPAAVLGLWQVYEGTSTGVLPASVLAGYMQSYQLQAFAQKLRNAAALTAHLGWILFPAIAVAAFWNISKRALAVWFTLTIGAIFVDASPLFWASASAGVLVLLWCAENREFISRWVLLFFGAALVIFFAGSARYLLPLALPIAILASRRLRPKWLYAGACLELLLSLSLAVVNYKHWDGYRQFARALEPKAETKRVWINAEWGLRFYLEAEGALPLMRDQPVHPGEIVVSSSLADPITFTTGGGARAPLDHRTITSSIPLRLVALHGRSAYSTAQFGLRPFDISREPIDRIAADLILEAKPGLEDLPMNAPEADRQIISGIYSLENGNSRWMAGTGVVILKAPKQPEPLRVSFYIPPQAPARLIRIWVDGRMLTEQTYASPGAYTLETPRVKPAGQSATVTINVDRTFSVPGDQRVLGVVLIGIGFKPGAAIQ